MLYDFFSLAASLLPTSTATVGFGGYLGSSRVDSSLTSEDAIPCLVWNLLFPLKSNSKWAAALGQLNLDFVTPFLKNP